MDNRLTKSLKFDVYCGFINLASFLTISAIYMLCLVSTGLLDKQSIFLEACYLVLCTLAHMLTAIATILTVCSKYYMQYQLMLLDPRDASTPVCMHAGTTGSLFCFVHAWLTFNYTGNGRNMILIMSSTNS